MFNNTIHSHGGWNPKPDHLGKHTTSKIVINGLVRVVTERTTKLTRHMMILEDFTPWNDQVEEFSV